MPLKTERNVKMPVTQQKRQTELDILRFLAILAVIAIHASETLTVQVFNFSLSFHVLIVWCVPIFFMISGRFFLDPERNVTTKKILVKYVPHIAIAYVVWSAIYTLYYYLTGSYSGLNIFGVLEQFIEGPYHFWYLYVLIGLYLITPFLRKIAQDDTLLFYFLILFSVINVILEYLIYVPKFGTVIETFIKNFDLNMPVGYVGYFMIGYFIWHKKEKIGKKAEITIYAVGAIALIGTVVAEGLITSELKNADFVKQYMKPNVIIYSAAIYTFFIKRISKINFSDRSAKAFGFLTEMGFGVYCIHALINAFIKIPASLVLTRTVSIYLISLLLTFLIRKIPVVGKKIT